jgi:hypothetical protein
MTMNAVDQNPVCSLRLPREAYEALKAQAEAQDRSIGSLLRHIALDALRR